MNTNTFLILLGFILSGGFIGSAIGYLLGLSRGFEIGYGHAYDELDEGEYDSVLGPEATR
jgi:hypothetical protein